MKTAISHFGFGSMIFGILLVFLEYFILPWRLIKRSALTLASWGRSRILPTGQSDLPILTFITVLYRPIVHVLVTVIGILFVVVVGIITMFHHSDQDSFMHGMCILIVGPIAVYLVNFYIGLIFDVISIVVQMANSLRNIERK